MPPKISIITPSFNQGKYLEETIVSVLTQGYANLEYIIIDGGSTDGSINIIKKYENKISYWVSEKDTGQAEAINKGLKKANGDIIAWLCSDDVYLPGTLLKVSQIFNQNPEAVLVHGKSILFSNSKTGKIIGANESELPLKYFSVIPFPQPSSFFRRKLIDEQGLLDETLHYAMDYDLLIRAALHYQILNVKEVFSKYRFHSRSKTMSQPIKFAEEWSIVFSKFLRSVPNSKPYIEQLKKNNLYAEASSNYNHNRHFTENELKLITLYFLETIAHIYYNLLKTSIVLEIAEMIRSIDIDFYNARKINRIMLRSKFIPSSLIQTARIFLR